MKRAVDVVVGLVPVLLALGLLLGVAACPAGDGPGPGDDTPDGGSGTGGSVDVGCARDEDCGAEANICDLATGDCVPGLDCTQNNALCDFCGDFSAECGFGVADAYCSAEAGVCRRRQGQCGPCAADDQCAEAASGLPSVCREGFCAIGCGACPPGFACEAGGCVPAGGIAGCSGTISCLDDPEACPDDETCTALGVCLALCDVDAECGLGEICNTEPGPTQNQCIAGCPIGETVIQDGVEKVCHADGRFGLPCPTEGSSTGCTAGTECDANGVCQRAGCQSDAECPLIRTFCDVANEVCVDGCNSVDDCGAFELCEDGQCVAQGCLGKDLSCDLGEWCCGTEAFSDPSTCPAPVVDGDCFLTPEPWCRLCEENADCADIPTSGFGTGQASLCYELQTADGTSLGSYCSVGCNSNADCPRGIDCVQDLPTEEAGVTTSGCLDQQCFEVAAARQE